MSREPPSLHNEDGGDDDDAIEGLELGEARSGERPANSLSDALRLARSGLSDKKLGQKREENAATSSIVAATAAK